MLLIISKVLVVFIYIGIGFIANRTKVLPEESSKYLINLIMEITVPCLVISSITGQELDGEMYWNTIITFVLTIAVFLIIMAVSTFFADRVFRDIPQEDRNVLAVAMTSCNSGFMGFPVTKAVFGPSVFYYVVIQNISNNLYCFILSHLQFHHREKREHRDRSLQSMLKPFRNISTISTFVSIIMLFAGIRLPAYFQDIFTTVGDVTIPVSMILVGVQLGGTDFRTIFRNRDLLITAAFRLLLAPAIIALVLVPVPIANVVKLTAVICTCFPSAVIGVAMSAREHKNSLLMAEAVATSTMLSLFTLPLWIVIVSRLYL